MRLMVYVGGLTEKEGSTTELFDKLRAEDGHQDDVVWVYPDWLRPRTRGRLAVLADDLSRRIGAQWADHAKPEIVLIGHSAGGVLARYAYLIGLGCFGNRRADWAAHVTRIVLLAAPNRGVGLDRLSWPVRVVAWVASVTSRRFAAVELLAGSPFMTNLRVEWVRAFDQLEDRAPIVVQVRGKADPLVEPEDSRDVVSHAKAAQLDLPHATHADIVKVSGVREDSAQQRYRILRQAIIGTVEPNDPEPLPDNEQDVTEIVFLLHGIRSGIHDWVPDLQQRLNNGDDKLLPVGDSYGWFSAYNFAFPLTRRKTLRWFQDLYTYYALRHPNVPIHFVGHSNGTYMFGQSIRAARSLRFQRVYLAGTVLPRKFRWVDHEDQVETLVNVCAAKDKPVAWLCSALRGLGMRDIGLGGYDGFEVTPADTTQLVRIGGGHGAGVAADRLPSIVDYIRSGVTPRGPTVRSPWWFGPISRIAPGIALVLAVGLVGLVAWTALSFSLLKLALVLGSLLLVWILLRVV